MMSKKIDLEKELGSVKRHLDVLIIEHDSYSFESEDDVKEWFNSLPIESLNESLLLDNGKKIAKMTLADFSKKSLLRKEYYAKKSELESIYTSLKIENINKLLFKIKSI